MMPADYPLAPWVRPFLAATTPPAAAVGFTLPADPHTPAALLAVALTVSALAWAHVRSRVR